MLPDLTVDLGSGDEKPEKTYPTTYGQGTVAVFPASSCAVSSTVRFRPSSRTQSQTR